LLRYPTSDITKNIPLKDIENIWEMIEYNENIKDNKKYLILSKYIRDSLTLFIGTHGFTKVRLFTRDSDFELSLDGNSDGKVKTIKAGLKTNDLSSQGMLIKEHDRVKKLPIERSFLTRVGLSHDNGKPKVGMSSKVSQIQKFVQILNKTLNDVLIQKNISFPLTSLLTSTSSTSSPNVLMNVSLFDMGCGKGYLTFAAHHFLSKHPINFFDVSTTGIDIRQHLVQEANERALSLGYSSLQFQNISISHFVSKINKIKNLRTNEEKKQIKDDISKHTNRNISLVTALHACDVATDDAIYYAIDSQADALIVAPCCHKQVRSQMNKNVSRASNKEYSVLKDIMKHNIHSSKIADMVTDTARALLLEIENYNTQVFEFIDFEHTSKNIMIVAIKRKVPRSYSEISDLKFRLKQLLSLFNVNDFKLADWLNS